MIEGLLQSGLVKVRSMHRVDAFGNSLGVCRKLARVLGVCQDGAREFAKRRSRLAGRLSGVVKKLVESRDGLVMDILKTGGLIARLLEVARVYGNTIGFWLRF
ncbi:hypothetical protein B296_00045173 [Ensete ventricosum]|uniref:Uncharacterized protein n=1 Tax=Ensete ventricosum TaxID=4639 RepID=A0A426XJ35_ENSVE|nr:hypothetical protein B296_00045173 [Ensete ventricosum]